MSGTSGRPIDREAAEKELTRLINRALRSVMFVKLDKVEEVTELFTRAIDLLEANCDIDPEERERLNRLKLEDMQNAAKKYTPSSRGGGLPVSTSTSDSEDGEFGSYGNAASHSSLAAAHQSLTQSALSGSSSSGSGRISPVLAAAQAAERERERSIPDDREMKVPGTPSMSVVGGVRRDYSSPKGATRALTKKPQPGASSRATGGVRTDFGGPDMSSDDGEEVFPPRRKEAKFGSREPSDDDLLSRPRRGSGSGAVAPIGGSVLTSEQAGVPAQPIGSVVRPENAGNTRVARGDDDEKVPVAKNFTADTDSPKGQVRSLAFERKKDLKSSRSTSMAMRVSPSISQASVSGPSARASGAGERQVTQDHGLSDDSEDRDEDGDESMEPTVPSSSVGKSGTPNRVLLKVGPGGNGRKKRPRARSPKSKIRVPVEASPRQYESARRLLAIASPVVTADTLASRTSELERRPPGLQPLADSIAKGIENLPPNQQSFSTSQGLLAHAHDPQSNTANQQLGASLASSASAPGQLGPKGEPEEARTPSYAKPAFLRRLDSPLSHHGKLLSARQRLNNMLSHSLRLVPSLRSDAFPEVKKAFVLAINKLESGTMAP